MYCQVIFTVCQIPSLPHNILWQVVFNLTMRFTYINDDFFFQTNNQVCIYLHHKTASTTLRVNNLSCYHSICKVKRNTSNMLQYDLRLSMTFGHSARLLDYSCRQVKMKIVTALYVFVNMKHRNLCFFGTSSSSSSSSSSSLELLSSDRCPVVSGSNRSSTISSCHQKRNNEKRSIVREYRPTVTMTLSNGP